MKRPIALLLSCALCLSLTACGSNAAQAQGTDTPTPSVEGVPLSSAAGSAPVFTDIPADADYAEAVLWCHDNGLMNGVSDTNFDLDGTLTRSMVAAILYRAEDKPAVIGTISFTDTQADTDPTGPESGNAKIVRGGGWNDHPNSHRPRRDPPPIERAP